MARPQNTSLGLLDEDSVRELFCLSIPARVDCRLPMRKIVSAAFLSLDGVMQAPGGPEEDASGVFRHGGWTKPFWSEATGAAVREGFAEPFDILIGRRTYDIFAGHWPRTPKDDPIGSVFNRVTKYVATHRPESLGWENSEALGPDVLARVRALKASDGPTLLTQGSSELVHLLLANDLVDELRVSIFPVLLGKGKRFFGDASVPRTFELVKSVTAPNGVFLATYQRAGEVKTGSFALEA